MSLNRTNIEWALNPDGTQGFSWNPITGCLNGCDYCYARKLANTRLKDRYLLNAKVADIDQQLRDPNSPLWDKVVKDPFYPRFWEDRLLEVQNMPKNKGVFVCDMSDLFGIGVPEDWTRQVLNEIEPADDSRFYLLTKQPQNLIKFSPFPDNCWVGVSWIGDDKAHPLRYLQGIEAKVKYISFEPLLEFPGWWNSQNLCEAFIKAGIRWVIIGSQTKPYKPPKIEWVREIVEACDKAGIPVFLKDNLKPLLGRDYSKGIEGYAPIWAYRNHQLRQEIPIKER